MRPRARIPMTLRLAALAAALLWSAAGARAVDVQRKAPAPADPYRTFRYRLRWRSGATPVAGFGRAVLSSPPPAPTSPAPPPGKALRTLPKPADLVLERGLSRNPDFAAWIAAKGSAAPEKIHLDEADETGHVTTTKTWTQCRPVECQAVPDLDAGASATRIVHLVLRCTP